MIEDLSIPGLLSGYRSRMFTPLEVLRQVYELTDHCDPAVWISRHAWSEVESMAANLADRDPNSLPLYGIPFAVKDNIDVAGLPTTAACTAYAYQPSKSAYVVEKLVASGAVPMGKTNLDQFATGLTGVRSPYGIPANAFNPDYISGGSSSGSALAVALGLASFSLGTDTAGSGRVPASFNNLVGVKPTRGLLSCSGVVPACRTLDCVSIFALTANDALSVLEVAGSFDPDDPFARHEGAAGRLHDESSITIGVPRGDQLAFFGDGSARALFERSVARLQEIGWRVKTVDVSAFLDAGRLLYEGPWVAERYAVAEALLTTRPEAFHPITLQIIGGGSTPSAVEAFKAQYRLAALRRESEKAWRDVDAMLMPTAGTIYKMAEVEADPIKLNSNLGYYTNFMNLLDLSAWAVPAGFLDNGLPLGVTFFAPAFEDRFLATLASRFHASGSWLIGKSATKSDAAPLVSSPATGKPERWMKMAVCGAHMEGLGLNHQLVSRGARLVAHTTTAPSYRAFLLPGKGTIPDRPGLIRVPEGGAAIEAEVWELPQSAAASFIDAVPKPLGFGRVELADGTNVCGFLCESYAVSAENEITQFGGWRAWLAQR